MAGGTVLTTQAAQDTIAQMQNVLGGLDEHHQMLNQHANTLQDPGVWQGNHADQFRALWGEVASSLAKTQEGLQRLHTHVRQVNTDIMAAGGNG